MAEDKKKVAIVGAGFVGSTLAYTLVNRSSVNEIVLIDIDRDRAEGEALDLNHSILFLRPVSIWAGDYSECRNADLIVMAAGPSIKPGETRLDLARKNWDVTRQVMDQILRYNSNPLVLIVSNPVDILTYFAAKYSGIPSHRVIGSGTVLDSSRFRYLLSQEFKVDVRNVHGYIIGEHGDSEVPAWSLSNISGTRIEEYGRLVGKELTPQLKDEIFNKVVKAGYVILEKKGSTYYGIGMAACRIIEAVLNDENSVLTVSSILNGIYGIEDVALSVPSVVNRQGIVQIPELPLDNLELEGLKRSAQILKEVITEVERVFIRT